MSCRLGFILCFFVFVLSRSKLVYQLHVTYDT